MDGWTPEDGLKRQRSKNKLSQIRSSSGSELHEELCAQVGTVDEFSLTHVTLKASLSLSLPQSLLLL